LEWSKIDVSTTQTKERQSSPSGTRCLRFLAVVTGQVSFISNREITKCHLKRELKTLYKPFHNLPSQRATKPPMLVTMEQMCRPGL